MRRIALCLAIACTVPAGLRAQGAPRDTLVMPFDHDPAEPRLYWLTEGSSVMLAAMLEGLGGSAVAREERVRAFERLQLPSAAALSHATVIKVGQLVRAADVVIGRFELVGDRLTVRARLIRLDTGRMLPELVETGALSDLVAVYARTARALRGAPGPAPIEAGPLMASPAAIEAYSKGLIAETPATQQGYLEQALKLAADDRVRLALADVLSERGEHQRAFDTAMAVPDGSRWRRPSRYSAALSLVALTRYDDAFALLKALDADSRSAVVLNAMGVVQLRRGAAPSSGRPTYYFSQATEADPTQADYFFNLGYAYWLDRDPQAAIYWLREAVRRDPADRDAHEVLGTVLQQTGAPAEAARERELARRLTDAAPGAPAAEARDAVQSGLERIDDRLDQRGALVDAAIASSGQRDHAELAAFHLDAGRRAFDREADREAEQELRRALYLSPYLAEAHLLLGRIYLRGGRASDAIDALKIALWSEATPAAHLALAEAYAQTQNLDAARAEVERALALEPTSEAARKLRDRLSIKPPGSSC
jgi:tetratricopeptide (TPR) repeat protein